MLQSPLNIEDIGLMTLIKIRSLYGFVCTSTTIAYCSQLQSAFALNQPSIIDAVVQKAHSMTAAWIPAIVDEVRREGIKLPGVVTNKLV